MISYIGAFPFLEDAPAVLEFPQMIMVVSIMTERYRKILAKGSSNRRKLLFKSLAVFDRKISEIEKSPSAGTDGLPAARSHAPGFAVDTAGEDEEEGGDDDDDDELVLAAFDSLDLNAAFKTGDAHAATTHGAMIPADNFRRLLMLLLLIAPMDAQENLSTYADRVIGDELESLRETAENILTTFIDVEKSPGIKYSHFENIVPNVLPFLFNGFNSLFEHFLFSRNLDLSKKKEDTTTPAPALSPEITQPLLPQVGQILNLNVLSQLSFFMPGDDLFRRLRLLYSGSEAGFSMGSFETKVFNWRAPTLFLVSGTRISDSARGGPEATFNASIPPKRFPDGSKSDRLVFGVFVKEPWRHTSRECFGGPETILFQLSPVHDVFRSSSINHDYVSISKPPGEHSGIAFGCPVLKPGHRNGELRHLGPVSLLLDSGFEFGVFTHDYTSRGGAFRPSSSRRYDFQDRFQVDDLEVWGCGGDEEAKIQRERWEWEAREAEARRRINLGTGDKEADRQLLEMAGLVGGNRSGGSMS